MKKPALKKIRAIANILPKEKYKTRGGFHPINHYRRIKRMVAKDQSSRLIDYLFKKDQTEGRKSINLLMDFYGFDKIKKPVAA